MNLRLFDSLTNKVIELKFQDNQTVNIYLCGPTVYDNIHIGNLRPVIIFDVLHRLLLNSGLKVKYVHNITDIDDKIINRSQKENRTEKKIADHYTKAYLKNLYNYNVLSPSSLPRVTNFIEEIKIFIKELLKNKSAYWTNKDILFSLENNWDYDQFLKQKKDQLLVKKKDLEKRDFRDFTLWKITDKGISWQFFSEKGRPGWHTECVVFIQEIFQGKTIDIHGGGKDLIFPHHANERIQYLSRNNKELSKIWLHTNYLSWKKEKMSKSLGNVILAKNFYRKYGANVLRHLILSSDFRQEINISDYLIQQSSNYIQKINNLLKRLKFFFYSNERTFPSFFRHDSYYQKKTIQILSNNINTVKCLNFIDEIISSLNKLIDEITKNTVNDFSENIQKLLLLVNDFLFTLNILGFDCKLESYSFSTKILIEKWKKQRKEGKYLEADEIRKVLQNLNVI